MIDDTIETFNKDGFNIHGILINVENIDQKILDLKGLLNSLVSIKDAMNEEIGRGTDRAVMYGWIQELADGIST